MSERRCLNRKIHGVSFEEAATTFFDPGARIYDDPDHSLEERRFLLVGLSAGQRSVELLIVSPERGERIRLISARRT